VRAAFWLAPGPKVALTPGPLPGTLDKELFEPKALPSSSPALEVLHFPAPVARD